MNPFWCVFFFLFFPHLRLSFVVFTTEEISFQCWAVSQLAEKAPDISQRSAATVLRWRLTFMTTLIHIYCKELWRSVSIVNITGKSVVAPFQLPVITGVFCAIMQILFALAFSGLSVCVNVFCLAHRMLWRYKNHLHWSWRLRTNIKCFCLVIDFLYLSTLTSARDFCRTCEHCITSDNWTWLKLWVNFHEIFRLDACSYIEGLNLSG